MKNSKNGKYGTTNTYDVINKETGFVFATVSTRSQARRVKKTVKATSGVNPNKIGVMQYSISNVR